MSAIKVISKTTPEDPEMVEIGQLRHAWVSAKRQLDSGVLGGACCVSGCHTMPFVSLRTGLGPRALCLRHFEKLSIESA